MFTTFSSDVVEFQSTFKYDQTVDLLSRSVLTDPPAEKCDAFTNTISPRSVSIQTESPVTGIVQLKDGNEKKLAQWLQKILPLVEEELRMGMSPCLQTFSSRESQSPAKISFLECLNVKIPDVASGKLVRGAATWLSLATGGAPSLALACTTVHESWCEHNTPSVILYVPKRTDSQGIGGVNYTESQTIPVKSCIQILSTNSHNRDIFAGGTVLGDLYIWHHEQHQERDSVRELFSGTTQNGEIVAMSWLKQRPSLQDVNLLTCHTDGVVESWKILASTQVIHEKTFRISAKGQKFPAIDQTSTLKTIVSIDDRSEFVIGTEDGRVILCSANQLSTIRGAKNVYDPVLADLEAHQFPVTSLQMVSHGGRQLLASCDLTGEVFFHDITGSTSADPVVILKMPLPFKNTIAIGKNLQFIVSPGEFGSLEIFTASSGLKSSIDGNLRGKGNVLAISNNR
ncbi:uncharacterized protein LOC132264943 [Phlebotomus argentipes]|uniref:uncharacterized protein LOC132264943 n=1 Tax=Phlebotomus argentipes TaxID=94469 RepID=UPI0028935F76|nr:uncharacterized protein LOC132264943 [Phlebotomus argentipes]